jgi:HD superfamily phosphohydrolase
MQRLYDLRQLGLTDRVFIDASHLRIHHTIGTLEQVDRILNAIVRNLKRFPDRPLRYGPNGHDTISASELAQYVEARRPVVRLVALLHDATHAPFGHTLEDEIHLVSPGHDHPDRQARVFYRLLCEYVGWLARDGNFGLPDELAAYLDGPDDREPPDFNTLAELVFGLLSAEPDHVRLKWMLRPGKVAELLAQVRMAMTALLHLKHSEDGTWQPSEAESYPFQKAVQKWLEHAGLKSLLDHFRFNLYKHAWMLDVVGNTVCADLLDYAKRDARNAGINLDYDDRRIVENFTIRPWSRHGTSGVFLRAAVLVFSHKFRTDVPGELMNLLNVRYYIYERAIYHSTKCAADAMLGTALQLLGLARTDSSGNPPASAASENTSVQPGGPHALRVSSVTEALGRLGDSVFLHVVTEAARLALASIKGQRSKAAGDYPLLEERTADEILRALQAHRGSVEQRNKAEDKPEERIKAGLGLLVRLAARRYYRPVFRALPTYGGPHINAEMLAECFRNPKTRFDAERQIEDEAGLPLGSVVIHCPKLTTARKLAETLLVNRTGDGFTSPCTLAQISELEPKGIFAKHGEAIRAVEEMYKSMWRLVVYVSPDQLANRKVIAEHAATVLGKIATPPSASEPESVSNDKMLELELSARENQWKREPVAAGRAAESDDLIRDARLFRLYNVVHAVTTFSEFTSACRGNGLAALVASFDDAPFEEALRDLPQYIEQLKGQPRPHPKRQFRLPIDGLVTWLQQRLDRQRQPDLL